LRLIRFQLPILLAIILFAPLYCQLKAFQRSYTSSSSPPGGLMIIAILHSAPDTPTLLPLD